MLKFRSVLWAISTLCLIAACDDDIAKVSTGQLEVSPNELVFAKPAVGEATSRLSLRITNVGLSSTRIASVTLTEDDESTELSMADADDWQSVKEIAPNSSTTVTVEWVPLDATADTGTITIRHNAGNPIEVPVKTSDIDPVIDVTSNPEAIGDDGVVTITMDQASAGRLQRARIEASSRSVAPLTISKICFIDANGRCIDGHTDGAFTLCAGTPDTPMTVLPQKSQALFAWIQTLCFQHFIKLQIPPACKVPMWSSKAMPL